MTGLNRKASQNKSKRKSKTVHVQLSDITPLRSHFGHGGIRRWRLYPPLSSSKDALVVKCLQNPLGMVSGPHGPESVNCRCIQQRITLRTPNPGLRFLASNANRGTHAHRFHMLADRSGMWMEDEEDHHNLPLPPRSTPYCKKHSADTPTPNNPKHASISECQKELQATQTALFAHI
ncbi:hypothetical protein ROHU_018891 [Labeo rohita]|uniref:Uncharacterized protein n=1 Tax=Labeo rohita TaxID=84645 RepID=A0A498NB88_LABRO|nr:hypothetical protein ROHU_018891 [Labeo rohita]